MLQDLDKTLEAFLRAELPAELKSIGISFAAPDEKFPPAGVTLPAISLFLTAIQENKELRTTDPIVERRPDNSTVLHRAPARVDCFYLATAFSSATQDSVADEHRILGELMRTMFRFRELPDQVLQGSLREQSIPIRTSSPLPASRESGIEMWEAFKVKPRAALHYAFTIKVDAGHPSEPQGLVTSVRTEAPANPLPGMRGVETLRAPVAIFGQVTDAITGQPLAGAFVQLSQYPAAFSSLLTTLADRHADQWDRLPGRPDRARSGADGTFSFLGLPVGRYALRVTLPGAGLRYAGTDAAAIDVVRDAQGQWQAATANVGLTASSIRGKVVDDTAAGTEMAEVRLVGSGESTFTDSDGAFLLNAIEPGPRTIQIFAHGFEPKTITGVIVQQGRTTALPDVILARP